MALADHLLPLDEGETVWLLYDLASSGYALDLAFGTGGCAIRWPKGTPMPEPVRRLGFKRGILNQNTGGAGI